VVANPDSTASGKSPAFQFYPNDFLSDRNVIVMSLQERGAYITLLCLCWHEPLPNDPDRLAALCGVPVSTFRKLWPALAICFRDSTDQPGRLVHPRLERERHKQLDFRRRQSDNGKKGGRPKNPTLKPTESHEKGLGSSGLTQTEPKKSSSVFSLQSSSSDFSQERTGRAPLARPSGLMAGTLPRDHLNCRQPCIRVCVSQKQHGILRQRFGGRPEDADGSLDAFYADVRARLPDDQPIGDRPWEFWDKQFAARYGTTPLNSKTAGNSAARDRFVARGQQ
jgi:uncharacterized protein YdaU (DUF1376 family)